LSWKQKNLPLKAKKRRTVADAAGGKRVATIFGHLLICLQWIWEKLLPPLFVECETDGYLKTGSKGTENK
jgi:hypothetical protein